MSARWQFQRYTVYCIGNIGYVLFCDRSTVGVIKLGVTKVRVIKEPVGAIKNSYQTNDHVKRNKFVLYESSITPT